MEQRHPIILELLKKRGIQSEAEMLEFFSEKPKQTYDPFLLHNMAEGVDLILSTIKCKEKICIYGDYDADGVTSTGLLLQFLKNLTEEVSYYIPSRFDEGYGMNKGALDTIKGRGTSLVITVDCGSVSYDEVEYGKSIGLKIIVTDHHNISDQPANCILINPKQAHCTYPFKQLSGCGVAFKLAQALQRSTNMPKGRLSELLDLVAIATIGDIVPLVGENRTLVKYGMGALKKGKRKGLAQLIKKIGLEQEKITSENIAYAVVPHLNAAGRMLDAKIGVELLTCQDDESIRKNVSLLISSNEERKAVQEKTFQRCLEIVRKNHEEDLFLVVYAQDAHEGIAGIVAGKLKDEYGRPAMVVTPIQDQRDEDSQQESYVKGTGRSIESIDLYRLLKGHEELFERFGGHAGACGFSMKSSNLEKLRMGLKEDMESMLNEDENLLVYEEKYESVLNLETVNLDFVRQIQEMEPFGYQNEKPAFKFQQVLLSKVNFMGSENQHMRFVASGAMKKELACILFNGAKDYENRWGEKESVTIIGYPEINVWRNKASVQLRVTSVRKD
ncbi:MAG: single-stranded-DNA-specific exonuclease RecJ [Anaerovorax sp.]